MTNSNAKTAILLVNLGTPTAPTTSAVRRFLAEFLGDRRVVELPRWLWLPILYGVILVFRPRRSAEAYRKIWTEQGSPLLVFSRALTEKIAETIGATRSDIRVELAMRYGEPSIATMIDRLSAEGIRRLVVLPLYPQYSATSTGSVIDAASAALQRARWPVEMRIVGDYHAEPAYISALAESVENHWRKNGRAQKLLLSFHGIPKRCVDAGDPYFDQCMTTARLLRERLGLSEDSVLVTFQSRVGREQWLRPYTDEAFARLPGEGVRHLQVICPGFAVDCLETLEEIAIRGRHQFLEAGGETLEYIPALNAEDAHVRALQAVVKRQLQGWEELESLRDNSDGTDARS